MIKFEVFSRFTGDVKFTAEIDCDENASRSVKLGFAVRWALKNNADLRNADLSEADLRNADLRNANLRNANLWNANLWNANLWNAHGVNSYVKCIQIETYAIAYTSEVMQIGCERHPIAEWQEFDDERILRMDGKSALRFWRKYKSWIFQAIELCPAQPTKDEAAS